MRVRVCVCVCLYPASPARYEHTHTRAGLQVPRETGVHAGGVMEIAGGHQVDLRNHRKEGERVFRC